MSVFKWVGRYSSSYQECTICKVLVEDNPYKLSGHLRSLEHKKNVLFREQLQNNRNVKE